MADLFHIHRQAGYLQGDGGFPECQASLSNLGTELFGELHQFFFVPLSIMAARLQHTTVQTTHRQQRT